MKYITKAFAEKIVRDGEYDTKKYRYLSTTRSWGVEISRIERRHLGTTAALSPEPVDVREPKKRSKITNVEHWEIVEKDDIVGVYAVSWSSGLTREYRSGYAYKLPQFITNFCHSDNVSLHKVNSRCVSWRIDH